jgi:hypothetical protein
MCIDDCVFILLAEKNKCSSLLEAYCLHLPYLFRNEIYSTLRLDKVQIL